MPTLPPFPARRAAGLLACAGLLALAPGCALFRWPFGAGGTRPPAEVAREAAKAPPPAPAERPAQPPPPPAAPRSLADLVDLALSRDPATRATWFDARAAAAAAGSRRSLFLPSLDGASASLTRQRPAKTPGRPTIDTTTFGASGSLTWILLDLGARSALVDEADLLLTAARLAEHAAVADLVLRVQQTYYQYLAARALVESEAAALKQARTSLDAAEGRRRAGVATIAEVLQARTALSQVQLTLQQLEGQALAFRGSLATLAGLPASAPLEEVGTLPARVATEVAQPAVDDLIAEAEARSPDLARARAIADAAGARARATSRAWGPVLGVQGTAGWTDYVSPSEYPGNPSATPPTPPTPLTNYTTWSASVFLRIPTFQGLAPAYDAMAARANAEAARARADAAAQSVALGVWTSYQGLRTAARSIDTSRDLLASAQASAEVATGRYKEGVGSILDLLTAQAALESARAQDVRARTDYLVALAQLARATGRLELPPPAPVPSPAEGSRP